jgi:hypothetical protein
MAEIRRGFGGEGLGNERLPWLEPVEDEQDYGPEPGNGGRIALWLVVALFVLAVGAGAFVWWSRYRAAHADIGEVIHAPPGPYKEKPQDPGGLKVDEDNAAAVKMGTGVDINSPLDVAMVPEEPIARGGSRPAAAPPVPVVTPAPKAAAPVPATPTPAAPAPVAKAAPPAPKPAAPSPTPVASAGGSGTIQLGALGSEAKAKQVWKSLSGRFTFLQPLTMSITPVKSGDATLYRLRASGGDARKLCAQLKVAGETCNVVD